MREHELWREDFGTHTEHTFCLTGSAGAGQTNDSARASLGPTAARIWTVWAPSYAEAVQRYYSFMDWGDYPVIHEADREPYATLATMGLDTALDNDET